MKKINLNTYISPVKGSLLKQQNFYNVSLGNGFSKEFANKKEAVKFLAQTNRELNAKMYELNFLFSDILRTYRSSWIYLKKNSPAEYSITEKVKGIQDSFNLLVERSHFNNGNHFVFSHFHSIIESIKEICALLSDIFSKRGLTGLIYEINGYENRANYIKTCIVIFPKKMDVIKEKFQHISKLKVV